MDLCSHGTDGFSDLGGVAFRPYPQNREKCLASESDLEIAKVQQATKSWAWARERE